MQHLDTSDADVHVIIVAPNGVTGSLRVLIERLAGLGIETQTVADIAGAAARAALAPANPPALLVDLRDLTGGGPDEQQVAIAAINRATLGLPQCTPIAVTHEAPTTLMLACVRAGAADLIDLGLEGTAAVRQVVTRVWVHQRDRLADAARTGALRGLIEDLLKDLIKTERRSLDLEDRGAQRPAAILIVEPDRRLADELASRLEAAGITAYAFARGEDALASTETFHLALVAAQLPGIDGLATIAQLRGRYRGLSALLMTSSDASSPGGALAARAGDLGVVGFVHKPVSDLAETVGRLRALASDALGRAREHSYLERIKTRHEHVLARYRALPRPT